MVKRPATFITAGWALLATVALYFYIRSILRTYVGFYYDDADYILTAMALGHGSLLSPRLPGLPVLHSHWPGFSLLLVPFVRLFKPHWMGLKVVPFTCVALSLWIAARHWQKHFSSGAALALTALFAWNPETIVRAGAVMSEPLFLLLILKTIWVLEEKKSGTARGWMLGACAAAAALVRPEGVLLGAGLVLALFLWGSAFEALLAGLPTVGLAIVYFIFRAPLPGYWSDWLKNAPALNILVLAHQTGVQLLTLFAGLLFNLPLPRTQAMLAAGMALTLLALILVTLGIRALWRDETRRVETSALVFFSVTYFIFHIFWPVIDRRFLWPLLPIVLTFGASAIIPVERSPRAQALAALTALLLASYLWTAVRTSRATALTQLPRASLDWIRTQTSPTERILTTNPSMIYLYTERPAIGLQTGALHDAATFSYACLVNQVGIVLYLPPPPDFANLPATDALLEYWMQSQRWVDARVYAYEKIFENPTEGISAYRVKPNAAYPQAYLLYLSAMVDFSKNNAAWGKAKLTEALREDPNFSEAHTAYALVLIATGGSAEEAQRSLKEALRLDPTNPTTLAAVARFNMTLKRP